MKWTTVRVSAETLAKLEQVKASMLIGDQFAAFPLDAEKCRSGGEDTRDRIGLDRVIRRLIADRERWQARRRASRTRTRSKSSDQSAGDPEVLNRGDSET